MKESKTNRKNSDLLLGVNESNNSKTEVRNKLDALKQIISQINEAKGQVKFKIKELKRKIEKLPRGNPFDFTEYFEKQKEKNDIALGLFFDVVEENKIIHNQVPINTLIEDKEKLYNGFF